MEKNTILAIVLSVVVISAFYMIQGVFFPPQQADSGQTAPGQSIGQTAATEAPVESALAADISGVEDEDTGLEDIGPVAEQRITIDTGAALVVLTNAGGDVISYKLKEHRDRDDYVEMVLPGEKETHAFTVALGGRTDIQPITAYFNVNRVSEHIVEFYRDIAAGGGRVRLTKRYDFRPNEYMFELTVTMDGGRTLNSLSFSDRAAAYTLGSAPQFGPQFDKLDQRYEYRRFYTFTNGKLKTEKVNNNSTTVINTRTSWAAIAGKYFTLIAVPDATQYELVFSTQPEAGIPETSRLYFIRPPVTGSSRVSDVYRFYMGPKNQNALGIYDTANNDFKLRDMQFIKVANTSGFLGPLETLLKWLLMIFYKLIPNYGVAIILLTLLVKAVMFPLTKKSSESTLRMQTLSPKIKEIQTKYKDNPQKMNAEMGELYKKEGYNPLSGCLPMLIQFPIFIAMYNLFNNHFDLRGAMFIPGWIPDLSLPESVFSFAPWQIPILGWSDIRILPFLYVGSQLLYGKVTQTPDQQGNSQMKMMLYAMPIVFFFVLYNMPSGLTVYWIMSNVLTLFQQLIINKYMAKKKAAMAAANPEPVIVPRKKKRG